MKIFALVLVVLSAVLLSAATKATAVSHVAENPFDEPYDCHTPLCTKLLDITVSQDI